MGKLWIGVFGSYIFCVSWFLIKLNTLNELLLKSSLSGFNLLAINDYQPWKYMGWVIFYIVIGLTMLFFLWQDVKYQFDDYSGIEQLIIFLSACVCFCLMLMLIKEINIPIFQTICRVTLVSGLVGYALIGR